MFGREESEMILQTLKSEKNLLCYQKLTAEHVGVSFPMDYLKKARVRAAYDAKGTMIGGYLLQANASEIRVLKSVPQGIPVRLRRPIELTGLWFVAPARESRFRWLFWLSICADLKPFSNRDLVFSYSTDQKYLGRIYSLIEPQIIYAGEVAPLPGMSKPDHETICFAPVWKLSWLWLRRPAFFFSRMKPKSQTIDFKEADSRSLNC